MIDKIREQQLEQLSSQLKNELKSALLSFMTKNKPNKDNIELYHKLAELLKVYQIHNVTCYVEHLFLYLSIKYHDIGKYCKVQISYFLNYLCNGCIWDNEYRRDLTKLIKDIIDEVDKNNTYDFKLYIPDLFEQIEQKFYGKYLNIEKGMKEKINSFIMNCLTVNVKATDNKRPISDLYKKTFYLDYQDLIDIYNLLYRPINYVNFEFITERCRRISRIYLIKLFKENKGKLKEAIQCLEKWKNINNRDISIYSIISEMENQVFKIPVIKANNAYYCDREIDEILDFYNLKDFFYMKKECKRFSKVDLDILILIAKNINSKAWLYGGYIDWSLINTTI